MNYPEAVLIVNHACRSKLPSPTTKILTFLGQTFVSWIREKTLQDDCEICCHSSIAKAIRDDLDHMILMVFA